MKSYGRGGGGAGGKIGVHNPVWVFRYFPGRQNGAHPLVTPTSPGGHPVELTAGEVTVMAAIGAAASAATNSAALTSRRNGCVMATESRPDVGRPCKG